MNRPGILLGSMGSTDSVEDVVYERSLGERHSAKYRDSHN